MIFVSYSHNDRTWMRRFMRMAKPLERYAQINVWTDDAIKPGDTWPTSIQTALQTAKIGVLLVSDAFLASDFIMDSELPHLIKERDEHRLRLLWVALTPCLYKKTPIKHIQAVGDPSKPLNSLTEFAYKQVFCELCEKIDEEVKLIETPEINAALNGKSLQHVSHDLPVLAKPAFRDTEILLYSDDNAWYVQPRIQQGSVATTCWIGAGSSPKGGNYKIVALTCSEMLKQSSSYISLPEYRTKSREIIVKRA